MILLFFGPPGAGKGTQAQVVARQLGIPHVSTGVMLRREAQLGTPLGLEVAPVLASGELVSDDLMIRVIEKRLSDDDAKRGVLLDGFPRTVPQAQALDATLGQRGLKIDAVVALDVPAGVLAERIEQRSKLEGRADDDAEAFTQRMAVYKTDTAPVLDYYRENGTRVDRVNGDGTIEDVTARINDQLAELTDPVSR